MTPRRSSILAVGFDKQSRGILQRATARLGWRLATVSTVSGATCILAGSQAPVIVSEEALPDGTWKDLLDFSSKVIVVSRLADETISADVLEHGGYDVLASPLEERAVLHALGSVCGSEHHLAATSGEGATAAVR